MLWRITLPSATRRGEYWMTGGRILASGITSLGGSSRSRCKYVQSHCLRLAPRVQRVLSSISSCSIVPHYTLHRVLCIASELLRKAALCFGTKGWLGGGWVTRLSTLQATSDSK